MLRVVVDLETFCRAIGKALILRSPKIKVLVPFLSPNRERFTLFKESHKEPNVFLRTGRLRGLCLLCREGFKSMVFKLSRGI